MRVNPYLSFDGQCEAAIRFYEKVLGARVLFKMTWGEAPVPAPMLDDTSRLIMHATLVVGDGQIMCADSPPGRYDKPAGMNVSLHLKDLAEGERIFRALSEGGTVEMPFEKTFWSPGFGMCVDRFGIPWLINCDGDGQ